MMKGQIGGQRLGIQYEEPQAIQQQSIAERHTQAFEQLSNRLSSVNTRLHNVRRRIMGSGDLDKVNEGKPCATTPAPGNFDAVLNDIQDRQLRLIEDLDVGVSELERWVGV